MTSFKLEPFLWLHLAGLAVLPLLLQALWLSLAIGQPVFPFWLELALLAALGIGPMLWMQWTRPFDIFSLLFVALRPDDLTDDQRRILQLFKLPRQRLFAAVAAGLAFWLLFQLYRWSPLVTGVNLLPVQNHLIGLAIAALVFLACNLFLQVPLSVLGVLLRSQQRFAATEPYRSDRIARDFSLMGWRVARILPSLTRVEAVAAETAPMAELTNAALDSDATAAMTAEPLAVVPTEVGDSSVSDDNEGVVELPETTAATDDSTASSAE